MNDGHDSDPRGPHGAAHLRSEASAHAHSSHDSHSTGHHAGHDRHAGHDVDAFRRKFWLSLVLTVPTVIWGHMLPELTGFIPPTFPGSRWVAPFLGTAVFLYGGPVFLRGAVRELLDRRPGMMTLISLAITVAFGYSLAVTLGYPGMPLWEELATLVTVMLLGHWIEMRSIGQASGALDELAKLLPATAERLGLHGTETVSIAELREGDIVLVRPGASVPADGVVREGRGSVDESMITGESRPVAKSAGDEVVAGTVNATGSLRVEVTRTGDRTALAGIMRLVEEARHSRSRAQALADRAAYALTLVAVAAGAVTLAAWLLLGASGDFAVERLVTVLVIACPHALGLAIPLVIAVSTTLAARGGLLIRDRRGLEEARSLDTVVFDKTGTLTLGAHRVVDTLAAEGIDPDEALRLAAAVEADSEHPIAAAIVISAREKGLQPPTAADFESMPGRGVRARVEGRALAVGAPNLIEESRAPLTDAFRAFTDAADAAGRGVVHLIEDDRVLAAFALADAVRPESAEAVRRLHAMGIEVVMLTGDADSVARAVADQLGIDEAFARVPPEEKAGRIEALRAEGRRVAMVGDGVNDAPALLAADVGIAIGAGTAVAVEAGDVILVRDDPRDVARIVELSRATYRKMVQNLWWATGYNVIAIPLAAGVLQPWGIVLNPAVGAALMSASTVIVAINARMLSRTAIV